MQPGIGHNNPPQLRWYQDEAVQSLFTYFDDPKNQGLDPATKRPKKRNPLVCLPTGTGKSLVIAEFLRQALMRYGGTRAVMSTHVKELISQNASKMLEAWPHAPLGIYSAGLKQKDFLQPLIFGGVKSMVDKFNAETGHTIFSFRDFLIIDEAHLVSPNGETTYIKFIMQLLLANPYLKVIGLTATPYRLGLGLMTNGNIFTDIVYDLTNIDGFARLMAEGYLCPLIASPTQTEFDLSSVGMVNGDFSQAQQQAVVDNQKLTYDCLREVCEKGYNRQSWLIFASGVEHAEHICAMLNDLFNIPAVVYHSKRTQAQNDEALRLWQTGEVRCMVNMNGLTTGMDHPPCDLIAVMRGTMSTGLWVQMLGRGTRPYNRNTRYIDGFNYEKENCLCLDFARNVPRLGPINDPVIPKMKGQGPPGDAPVKKCDSCGNYQHASARVCTVCGAPFTFDPTIYRGAGTDELLRSDIPEIETYNVQHFVCVPHTQKSTGNQSIRVTYFADLKVFSEWVTVEGKAAFRGRDWFRQRFPYDQAPPDVLATFDGDVPRTNAEVLRYVANLRAPARIRVWVNKKYPEIVGHEF